MHTATIQRPQQHRKRRRDSDILTGGQLRHRAPMKRQTREDEHLPRPMARHTAVRLAHCTEGLGEHGIQALTHRQTLPHRRRQTGQIDVYSAGRGCSVPRDGP
jgi:hypothetical protein